MPDIPVGLQTSRPSGGFFDWASLSPVSCAATEARRKSLAASSASVDPPEHVRLETAGLDHLRRSVVEFIGAQYSAPCVVLGRSVSEFMSELAFGLSRRSRSRVAIVGSPHPSVLIAWQAAVETLGGELTLHAFDDESAYDERTLAVVATHVDHLFGIEQPLSGIVQRARYVGAISIIDGAQAVGRVHLELDATRPDIYIGSGRKALLAPLGTAFMSIDMETLDLVTPSVWSTRSAELLANGGSRPATGTRRLEGNLPDLAALAALHANVQLFTQPVVEQLRRHVGELLPALVSQLEDAGFYPLDATYPGTNVGISSFSIPPHIDGLVLQGLLKEAGVVVAATRSELRISLHFSNSIGDVTRLCGKVAAHAA